MPRLPGGLQMLERPAVDAREERQPVHRLVPEPDGPERHHPHPDLLQRGGRWRQGREVGLRAPLVPALHRRRVRHHLPGRSHCQARGHGPGDGGRVQVHRLPVLLHGVPVRRPPLPGGPAHDRQQVHGLRRPHRAGQGARLRHHVPAGRPRVRRPRRDDSAGARACRLPQGPWLRGRGGLRRGRDGRPACHPGAEVRRGRTWPGGEPAG